MNYTFRNLVCYQNYILLIKDQSLFRATKRDDNLHWFNKITPGSVRPVYNIIVDINRGLQPMAS
jgi:hypothetical protein